MSMESFEICTMCGEECDDVTVIDDETRVCEYCLGNEFIYCNECEEYWYFDAIDFYNLKDERTLCEHCAKDLLADGELTENDIESIEKCSSVLSAEKENK